MREFITKYLLPKFDEQSLFLMGFSFFGLIAIDSKFRNELSALGNEKDPAIYLIAWFIIAAVGMTNATYHVFSRAEKSKEHKSILLWFGIIVSLFAGLNAGAQMEADSPGWLAIFPLWNILSAFSPLWILELSSSPDEYVLDYDTTLPQVVLGIIVVSCLLYYCSSIVGLHWSLSFSVAVFYSDVLDQFIRRLLGERIIN